MASLLIVTSDPNAGETVEEIGTALAYRVRIVASVAKAKEWFSMHTFDVVLVDARYDLASIRDLLDSGWKLQPLMVGAVFHLRDQISFEWELRLLGIRVFSGGDALDAIKRTLQTVLESTIPSEDFPILLVEDLDSPRDIICSYIESLGYSYVVGVESAQEALSLLQHNPNQFCCVITDINMPEQSGTELIADIRRDENLSHLPVLVLTAYATADNLTDCIRAGATGFLVKPPRRKALRVELEKAKRILFRKQSPRLCRPEDVDQLEKALNALTIEVE